MSIEEIDALISNANLTDEQKERWANAIIAITEAADLCLSGQMTKEEFTQLRLDAESVVASCLATSAENARDSLRHAILSAARTLAIKALGL